VQQVLRNAIENPRKRRKVGFRRKACLLFFVLFMNSSLMFLNTVTAARTLSGSVGIINAADGTSTLNFTTSQKNVGDTFLINITIIDAVNVATWQVGIRWDSSLLDFVNVTLPSDNVFADKSPLSAVDGSAPGLVVMGASVGPNQTAFDGSGILAQVTLKISKAPIPGQTLETDLNFEGLGDDTFLLDPNLVVISANYTWNRAHFEYTCQKALGPVHDVAVTDFALSNTSVVNGSSLDMNVTVLNNGNFTETFTVTVTANSTIVAPTQTTSIESGMSATLTFIWNTTGWRLGDYTIIATANFSGDPTPADNTLIFGVIHVTVAPPPKPKPTTIFTDPSTVQSTAIGQDFTVNINVSGAIGLIVWQAGVVFNSTVLDCTGFYEGEFLKRSGDYVVFANGTETNQTLGTVCYGGGALMGDSPGVNGSGQLGYLTFTSVGIGFSDFHVTDAFLLNRNLEDIPFEVTDIFTVPVNGTNYGVEITGNITGVKNPTSFPESGVFNTAFSVQNKKLSFVALATEDWFCQVSVPKELLRSNASSQWTVKADGIPIPYTASENATHTALYFSLDKGNHVVEIIGTNVIGENSQNPILQNPNPSPLLVAAVASLCMVTLVAALADLKKTRSFKLGPSARWKVCVNNVDLVQNLR